MHKGGDIAHGRRCCTDMQEGGDIAHGRRKTFQGKTFQGKIFQGKNFPGETFQGKQEMLSPKSCAGVNEYDANSFPGPP